MAFNWKAFATGFMDNQTQAIQQRMAKADAYEEKLQEEFERSKTNYNKRRQFVNQAMTQVNNLRRLGATDDQIKAATAAGPEVLFDFAEKLTKEASKAGKTTFSKSEIDAIVDMPDSFTEDEMTVSEFIERSYGLTKPTTGSTKAPKRSMFERAFGVDLKSEVRAAADREAAYDGYSMLDLNELARQDTYTSLVPGTYFSVIPTVAYDTLDVLNDYQKDIDQAIKRLEDSADYKAAIIDDPSGASQQRMRAERIMTITGAYANKYGQRFLEDETINIESLVGPEAYSSLQMQYGSAEEATKGITAALNTKNQTIRTNYTGSDGKVRSATFELDENGDPVSAIVDGVPVAEQFLQQIFNDFSAKGHLKAGTQTQELSEEEALIEDVGAALGLPTIKVEELPEGASPDTTQEQTEGAVDYGIGSARGQAQRNLDNKERLRQAMSGYTKEQWDDMSRAERREAGLPVRPLDLAFAGKDAFMDERDIVTDEDRAIAAATMPAEERAAIEQQTKVFFDAAKQRGIMDDPAKLEDFLQAYAEKNNLSEVLVMSLRRFIKNM